MTAILGWFAAAGALALGGLSVWLFRRARELADAEWPDEALKARSAARDCLFWAAVAGGIALGATVRLAS